MQERRRFSLLWSVATVSLVTNASNDVEQWTRDSCSQLQKSSVRNVGQPATVPRCKRPDLSPLVPRRHPPRSNCHWWRSARPRPPRPWCGGSAPVGLFLMSVTPPLPPVLAFRPGSGTFPSPVGWGGSPPHMLPPRPPRDAHSSPARRYVPPARIGCDACLWPLLDIHRCAHGTAASQPLGVPPDRRGRPFRNGRGRWGAVRLSPPPPARAATAVGWM